MKLSRAILRFATLAALVLPARAADTYRISTNHPDGVFDPGETVHWSVEWTGEDAPPSGTRYRFLHGALTETATGELPVTSGGASLECTLDKPGTMLLEVTWQDADGKDQRAKGGVVVAPEEIAVAAPPPDDFGAFWDKQLAALEKVPVNAELEPVKVDDPDVSYWRITMGNIRGSHIRGQLARPTSGEKFPALLIVQWAGVYPLERSWVTSRAQQGWLTLDIEAHDMAIDEPEAYYEELKQGRLKNYWSQGNDDRDTSYFLRMYLSCYRAADYLTLREDWDGRTLVVMGGSQGGMQSLVTAAIHPRITAALAEVPAGCDFLGGDVGRKAGWPQWMDWTEDKDPAKVREAARYYDVANFTPRIQCPVLVGFGLIDEVCPAAGILAAFNEIPAPKDYVILPVAAHQEINKSHEAYRRRVEDVWLPMLRAGKGAPVKN